MKAPISRREFVALSGGVVAGAALTRATSGHDSPSYPIPRFEVPLPIPRVLEPLRRDATTDHYDEIVQRRECLEILPGRHTTIWDTTDVPRTHHQSPAWPHRHRPSRQPIGHANCRASARRRECLTGCGSFEHPRPYSDGSSSPFGARPELGAHCQQPGSVRRLGRDPPGSDGVLQRGQRLPDAQR
jgi:hypothetical protein